MLPLLLVAQLASQLATPPVAPAHSDDRVRTVVLGLVARRNVEDPKLAAVLTDVIQGVYANDPGRIVIGRDDIARVLELEADKQTMGCESDKCLAEIGQALDAQRIVTGSLDKLGDGFMITMAEIDAKTLEALARGQERVKNDDNAIVDEVTRMATSLMQRSGAKSSSGRVTANAGSLEVETDPRGAKLLLGGADMGQTPTKIDNLATGTQRLRLTRDDYEPLEIDVPIHAGGVTKVRAELRILRSLAEQNLAIRQARWRDENASHQLWTWTKLGSGVVIGSCGLLIGAANGLDRIASEKKADGGVIAGLAIAGLGAGLLSWGVVDLLSPPAPPVPEWEIERKVVVTPPSGQGDPRVQLLQSAPARRE